MKVIYIYFKIPLHSDIRVTVDNTCLRRGEAGYGVISQCSKLFSVFYLFCLRCPLSPSFSSHLPDSHDSDDSAGAKLVITS